MVKYWYITLGKLVNLCLSIGFRTKAKVLLFLMEAGAFAFLRYFLLMIDTSWTFTLYSSNWQLRWEYKSRNSKAGSGPPQGHKHAGISSQVTNVRKQDSHNLKDILNPLHGSFMFPWFSCHLATPVLWCLPAYTRVAGLIHRQRSPFLITIFNTMEF